MVQDICSFVGPVKYAIKKHSESLSYRTYSQSVKIKEKFARVCVFGGWWEGVSVYITKQITMHSNCILSYGS